MSVIERDWSIRRIIIEGLRQGRNETPQEHDKIRSDLCALYIEVRNCG